MKLLVAALILPAAIVLAIAAFETRVFYPLPSNGPTRGIVWDGHTFATKTDFARWLRSQGSSYAIWARRHPVRAGIPPSPSKPTPQRLAARNFQAKAKEQAKPKGQTRAMGEKRSGSNATILLLALAVVGLLLGIVLVKRRPQKASSHRKVVLPKQPLEDVVRRGAAVAEGGAHVTMRWAAVTAHRSLDRAAIATLGARRRRTEVAWYLAMALFAVGIGLVVTVWMNGA
jgi:hypothetical protein